MNEIREKICCYKTLKKNMSMRFSARKTSIFEFYGKFCTKKVLLRKLYQKYERGAIFRHKAPD